MISGSGRSNMAGPVLSFKRADSPCPYEWEALLSLQHVNNSKMCNPRLVGRRAAATSISCCVPGLMLNDFHILSQHSCEVGIVPPILKVRFNSLHKVP